MEPLKTILFKKLADRDHWKTDVLFNNNNRRSGRTALIMARSIAQLLSDGDTIVTDHDHPYLSVVFYKKNILYRFYDILSVYIHQLLFVEKPSMGIDENGNITGL